MNKHIPEKPVGREVAHLLERVAQMQFRNAMGGQKSPNGERRFQRMVEPQVGDLVCEDSSFATRTELDGFKIGVLLALGNGENDTEYGCWTIRNLADGEETTWRNASFFAVLLDDAMLETSS